MVLGERSDGKFHEAGRNKPPDVQSRPNSTFNHPIIDIHPNNTRRDTVYTCSGAERARYNIFHLVAADRIFSGGRCRLSHLSGDEQAEVAFRPPVTSSISLLKL